MGGPRLIVGIHLTGQAPRRGRIHRPPSPITRLGEVEAWLRAEAGDTLVGADRAVDAQGPSLRASLHPAASPLTIRVDDAARVAVDAATCDVGPGYHTWLVRLLVRMAADVGFEWARPELDPASLDDTGFLWSSRRADVERTHLNWLRGILRRGEHAAGSGSGPLQLGDFGGHRFEAPGAVLVSALGPRDAAWLGRALQRPAVAADVWPWSADAPDGRYLLNRALARLWLDVRWRPPATDDERQMLDEVLRLLRRAFPLDPGLPYPWREWREVLSLAGRAGDPMSERVVREADRLDRLPADEPPPLVGYRRRQVRVVHRGWQLEVPGSWAERPGEDEWWGGEGGRGVTLAAVETGEHGEPMPATAFLERVAGHLGPDALAHRAGPVAGRARIAVDSSSGVEVATLEGYAAVLGSGAAIRIEIHDPADWEWALDLWRSLRPADEGPA